MQTLLLRAVIVITNGAFLLTLWLLSHRRLFALVLVSILVSLPQSALASCTTHTVSGPDGRQTLCTTCCSNGTCNTHCF